MQGIDHRRSDGERRNRFLIVSEDVNVDFLPGLNYFSSFPGLSVSSRYCTSYDQALCCSKLQDSCEVSSRINIGRSTPFSDKGRACLTSVAEHQATGCFGGLLFHRQLLHIIGGVRGARSR